MSTKAIPLSDGIAWKNCLKASRPPAEATMPTTAWSGRAADSVFSVFGDDGAAFLRLAASLVRSASAWPGFSWGAAFLTGIRSGSEIVKHQGHQISPAPDLKQVFVIVMNKPCQQRG